ncbi:hopanoid-associated sugar epimerase [Desulfoferrobacter suflitae]|uniref:hopanoid-associated sugar epimerase n=1 Tax=Desulfoferrobacter suflitae TaxID=2865782 RepID=UPI002164D603|nr:hopanoid-associated sugar epimerase [Desulfoferrobacter suflitae]MCK8602339.1 NAD-dependent epimerase/dehydratase family protein [Desulfoferrobacter suflitae]
MPTAFVTGASGFIGGHVAIQLLQRGWRVRALRRGPVFQRRLPADPIDWRQGDLKDFDQVYRAMAGCEAVFHVAADYRLWARNPNEIYANNVTGTANVLEAALQHGVRRTVYTSSVGALGLNPDGTPADEGTPVRLEDMVGHYKRSKFLAERKAEEFFRRGLPLVIVNPSTPVGPGDHKPTPTGRIIVDFLNGRMPAYLDTGLNIVHVSDVAHGHLAALEKGRIGEKYILGNENLTLSQIFSLLQRITKIPAPRLRLPHRPVLYLSYLSELIARLTGTEPLIPPEGVKMAHRYMFFKADKAISELGLPQTPASVALEDAVRWYRENCYVKR